MIANNEEKKYQKSGNFRQVHETSGSCIHHKFVIVDKKKLIHGSFNWTFYAITRNKEACVILTKMFTCQLMGPELTLAKTTRCVNRTREECDNVVAKLRRTAHVVLC